jgi:hypothetical protein
MPPRHNRGGIVSGFKTFLLLVFFFLSDMIAAHAAEIRFDGHTNQREKALIEAYTFARFQLPAEQLAIARPDLNEDGLNEYIIRTGCSNLCTFVVLAERDNEIIELGEIQARTVALGNDYSGSVRNIIALQDNINDYKRTVYSWEPGTSQYMIKDQDGLSK